ncbi:hypothetical protein ACVWXL_002939 [Bradyrhizobium sp. GM22.5]
MRQATRQSLRSPLLKTSVNCSATQSEALRPRRAPVPETSRIVQGALMTLPVPLSNSTMPVRKM